MSARRHQAPTAPAPISCALCITQLVEEGAGLLPEADVDISREHRSQCPDCRLFTEQLDMTRGILAAAEAVGLTEPVRKSLAWADSETWSVDKLRQVAAALGGNDADDMLQDVLVDAISEGRSIQPDELADRLSRAAASDRPVVPLSLSVVSRDVGHDDPDSEGAELFYPTFYEAGPDEGRFVDAPNVWGRLTPVVPEDEVGSTELRGITDAALDDLPEAGRRLMTLVDIEGTPLELAAADLGIAQVRAARTLHLARLHVRGAIDDYRRLAEV